MTSQCLTSIPQLFKCFLGGRKKFLAFDKNRKQNNKNVLLLMESLVIITMLDGDVYMAKE